MAFLDNSGDIILDAVLTDTGRFRMARGDFRIAKFALGDDEIDYSLYNKNHPSGSAYYDLEILRTPLLEAFTNNTSTMKSKLLSITQTNLLYLPVMKLLNGGTEGGRDQGHFFKSVKNTTLHTKTGGYIITCNSDTETKETSLTSQMEDCAKLGLIFGSDTQRLKDSLNFIGIERGLDNSEITPLQPMPATLQETQFIIEADYRLGALTDCSGVPVSPSFIDDDQIASYYVSMNTTEGAEPIVQTQADNNKITNVVAGEDLSVHTLGGPRDRTLQFKMQPSINLTDSNFLFEKLGTEIDTTGGGDAALNGFENGKVFRVIDTLVRVTSATTAYSIDIPIRYIKLKA